MRPSGICHLADAPLACWAWAQAGPQCPEHPRAPQSLFKILARVGQRRLGMGCEALLAWQGAQMPRVCLLC
ncbi:hypothetical protein CK621_00235 [Vandammella animalimorsus]|uniref:Uncharacterized protein n=1 Tax=Vandammella animalimorsus TaxID=2029117 RepID=A0A2A2B1Z5_9BURK|nr:hypothetical protein CK621_00235 [Vandammella animalimorsus]